MVSRTGSCASSAATRAGFFAAVFFGFEGLAERAATRVMAKVGSFVLKKNPSAHAPLAANIAARRALCELAGRCIDCSMNCCVEYRNEYRIE
ncbi:hypothetical protein [Paraburkholderia tropica]|uniref:hypothetical protein n=1 Tax=Paraburkholderia tropica TaxID=92647 RepID=UPI001CC3C1D0|nr:hypothetical protein [Paraburkholderia tropica]